MEPMHKNGIASSTSSPRSIDAVAEQETTLRERVAEARDLVEELRERAEIVLQERPYLLPVATGALGLGVGVLIGSKLSRILLCTAAGALLSETVRGELVKISRDIARDIGEKLDSDGDGVGDVTPS